MKDLKELWNEVLGKLSSAVSAVSFDMWIKTLEPIDVNNNVIYLGAKRDSDKEQVLKHFAERLQTSIAEVNPLIKNFVILNQQEKEEYIKNNMTFESANELSTSTLDNIKLNSKYTFENFVVGGSNNYVYSACRAVAENPSVRFNPLFIYGGVGLGKTHLMQAIGNYVLSHDETKKVLYITCENFANDYIEALRMTSTNDRIITNFRKVYRNADIFIIDDIQFISNKVGLQEEFFNTFNDLFQKGKQIIIASDRHPREISALEERLKSRFVSGLIQDIQKPNFEMRVAILQKKASSELVKIEPEVLNYIAETIDTNVRELEGVLHTVVYFANLLNKDTVTLDDAKEALRSYFESGKEAINEKKIIAAVANYYNISKDEMIGKQKSHDVSFARQVAIYLITEYLDLPLTAIGKLFSGRDHTTIMHARDKICKMSKEKASLAVALSDIKTIIG